MPIYDCCLWEYLKSSAAQERHIPMSARFKIFEKVLAGLRIIQNTGFRHLDIKPGNILLNTENGIWNETDLVITDFGTGGRADREFGLAGTPGFTSMEQLIGQAHRKSDNYAFGKLMIMIFGNWATSWNLLYQPVTENERNQIPFNHQIMHVARELVKVQIFI